MSPQRGTPVSMLSRSEASCRDASGSSFLRPCVTARCGLSLDSVSRGGRQRCLSMSVSRTWISPVPTFWTIALEIVAAGLPLFRGAQLAVDTTVVSVLKRDGSARTRCATVDGASLESARRRKEATYPELTGRSGRTKLVVLGCEVGGRWSGEAQEFLRSLAKAKARNEPAHWRTTARQAWRLRWAVMVQCRQSCGSFPASAPRRPGFRWGHSDNL